MTDNRVHVEDLEDDILDDDSFCPVADGDSPDETCGCDDDLYDDD